MHPSLLLLIKNKYCQFINCNQTKSMKKILLLNRVRGYFTLNSKVLRVMRLTVYLVLLTFFQAVAGNSYSQNTKLSFRLNDAKIKEVLSEIEANSEFYFLYNSQLVDVERRVNLNVTNKQIDQILKTIFEGQNVGYTIMDRQIIIQPQIINSEAPIFQKRVVTGAVTDETGSPLPGVTVVVKGTTQGTLTNPEGKYEIDLGATGKVLVFSFVGMKTEEVEVRDQRTINVTLKQEVFGLEEVVAIGYGTVKKASATGSIVTASGDEIKQSPTTNLTNNLVGRLPGLVSVSRSGEPGYDNSTLRIRGSNTLGDNSPLIVVDGIANRNMERIDPADIESITILKDASAAIYGAQAANGVILITTKRGKIGKPTISVNVNGGVQQPTRIPEMADAAQYAQMLNEIDYYAGRTPRYTDQDIQLFRDGSDPWGHPNTDWFGEVFKTWSSQHYENVSLSGGSENMKYFLSMGTRYQDGVYKNSATNYQQYDFRSNIDGKISDYIDVAFDVAGREELKNFPTRSRGSIFRMLMRGKPNMPAYWPDGTPGPDIEYGDNPAVTSTDATGYDKDKLYYLESNLRANVRIPWVKGLSVTANASFDKIFRFHKRFETPWYLYTWDGNPEHILNKGQRGLSTPQLTEDFQDGQKLTYNIYATYEKTLNDVHNMKVMVGTERQEGKNDYLSAFRKNYISSAVDQMFAGAADQYMTNDGYANQNARMNYFGRVNYDFRQKYLIEFVWRYDGSYMFPSGKQFGFFPGISAGWRISDEAFWRNNLAFLENFKLRGSWGQTGNDRIAEYQYLSSYGFTANRYYVFNISELNKLLAESRVPNPNVTWEVANQANIGFETSFFDNKMAVEADYFNNLRSDILWHRNASVPTSTGMTLPPENIGKVRNRGFEAVISYRSQIGKLKYDISVNGSYSKNKVVFWDETPGVPDYQRSTGKPMPTDPNNSESDLYYQAIGIFRDWDEVNSYPHWEGARPGDVIFKDVHEDGVIDGLDRVRSEKNNMPRFTGGMSINLQYGNFDLAMLFQGAAGAQVYVSTESGEIGNFYKDFADKRWTEDNPDAKYPRTFNRSNEYWVNYGNTFWLRSTDYIRLKNLELGYNLPSLATKKLGIEGLRFFVNGSNLLTLDKAKLFDPELEAGTSYPLQRVVNAGLTLTF